MVDSSDDEPAKAPFLSALRFTPRALALVWGTSKTLTLLLLALSLSAGALPAGVAWVGKKIVDGVLAASSGQDPLAQAETLRWVAIELVLVLAMAIAQRGIQVVSQLLRAQLGHRVNMLILGKAVTLRLEHFEDPKIHDKLQRSRREASSRPLGLVKRCFEILQSTVTLAGYAGLLLGFSPWAVLILFLTAVPGFVAETRFSAAAFRLFSWKTPEKRRQNYLEIVMSRLEYAKEVGIYGLGPMLLERYQAIYESLYALDQKLALRRAAWVLSLGVLATVGFYGVYVWVVVEAVHGAMTLGAMTMYLVVFKQGQSAFAGLLGSISAIYEDNLYLSTLYDFLAIPVEPGVGAKVQGPAPGDGLRFEGVGFRYPGSEALAVSQVSFHLPPGEKLALVGHNGSGKTTLIKLISRLYTPSEGRILLDGLDLQNWNLDSLRARVAVIFQDFAQYQMLAGENIGAGHVERFEDRDGWQRAAGRGMAAGVIEALPDGYETQLGRWFQDGRDLSGGQWQKVALSRAFMREDADLLILDEPTASMDAEAELELFEHVRSVSGGKMAILISHRFSTVRMADRILVLDAGRIIEEGSHDELMAIDGRYARLFSLQAQAFV